MVVLPLSVYRKTAYKKRPRSMEQMHISNCSMSEISCCRFCSFLSRVKTGGRAGCGSRYQCQGESCCGRGKGLAKLLVADIAFYHQPRLTAGLHAGCTTALLVDHWVRVEKCFVSTFLKPPEVRLIMSVSHFWIYVVNIIKRRILSQNKRGSVWS